MRIVVFSDSHNNFFALRNIVESQPSASLFLHLGDGAREYDDLACMYPHKEMHQVRGNCDWASDAPLHGLLRREERLIFYTHGHSFSVKSGLEKLEEHAREIGAHIALFGHTHQAMTRYENGLYLMNPGSVTKPADGKPSYGVIDITAAGIVLNLVEL